MEEFYGVKQMPMLCERMRRPVLGAGAASRVPRRRWAVTKCGSSPPNGRHGGALRPGRRGCGCNRIPRHASFAYDLLRSCAICEWTCGDMMREIN